LEVDRDEVLGRRVTERDAARRDEERVRPVDPRRDVPACRRDEPAVPGDAAEACYLLRERHAAALPCEAASPGSAAPRRATATAPSAATRIASSRFRWSATFRPAMSKAVPWPVEVRMSGSPTRSVTTVPKPSSLTAMSPWS